MSVNLSAVGGALESFKQGSNSPPQAPGGKEQRGLKGGGRLLAGMPAWTSMDTLSLVRGSDILEVRPTGPARGLILH